MNDVKKCPHCGKQLHSGAQYCMFCMTSLQPKQDITPKAHGGKKWGLLAVGLLAVGLLAALCLVQCGAEPETSGGETTEQTQREPSSQEQTVPEVTEQTEPALQPQTEQTEPVQTPTVPETTLPTTQPSEPTVPATTPTQPVTTPTQPATTPTAPVCAHYYLAATCLAPMTCTHCGDTVGTPDTNAHIWKPVTSVIHHEEVGHYEQVEVSYKKTVYLCFFCGYNQEGFDSMDALRAHISVHSNHPTYEMILGYPDHLADTREVWAIRTEEQWIVDEKAYDETVTTGYVCTRCNATKK